MPDPKEITPLSTPRERFMATKGCISGHQALVDGVYFNPTADAVLLEYTRKLTNDTDPTNAGSIAFKLKGAQEFLDLFKSFSEEPKAPPAPPRSSNLTPTDRR